MPNAQLTVVRKGSSILELLSGKDQSLLVRRDTLLVLDLRLDIVDSVGRLDLERDGLAREAIVSSTLHLLHGGISSMRDGGCDG